MSECYDCGLDYYDLGFCDLVVPHDAWKVISPTRDEGGLLCPTCMVRAARVAGLENISAVFRSGPFVEGVEWTTSELPRFIYFNPLSITDANNRRNGAYPIYAKTHSSPDDAKYELVSDNRQLSDSEN